MSVTYIFIRLHGVTSEKAGGYLSVTVMRSEAWR